MWDFNKVSFARALSMLSLCIFIIAISVMPIYADECPEGDEHDFEVELVKQASNTEDGLRTYTCKKCGYTFDEVIESFGHVWTEWKVVTAPTCDTTGIEERLCTKCDDSEQRSMDSLGHDWGEWHEEDGREVRECKRDPSHKEERPITVVESEEPIEDQEPVEEEPEEPVQETVVEVEEQEPEQEPEPEPEQVQEEEPESALIVIKEPEIPDKISWMDDWTPANTAVATGGSFILIALGALLFTTYISPWLWILAKRRKKREEVRRSMYV